MFLELAGRGTLSSTCTVPGGLNAQTCLAGRQQLDAYSSLSQVETMSCSIIPISNAPTVKTFDVHEAQMTERI